MDRVDSKTAGYMELPTAKKDGDCVRVQVSGGVSRGLGCCNLYQPASSATRRFDCGNCEYVRDRGARKF